MISYKYMKKSVSLSGNQREGNQKGKTAITCKLVKSMLFFGQALPAKCIH